MNVKKLAGAGVLLLALCLSGCSLPNTPPPVTPPPPVNPAFSVSEKTDSNLMGTGYQIAEANTLLVVLSGSSSCPGAVKDVSVYKDTVSVNREVYPTFQACTADMKSITYEITSTPGFTFENKTIQLCENQQCTKLEEVSQTEEL